MTRQLTSAILLGVLAVPAAALAQHSRGADTPSVGTAAPSSPAPAPAPAPASSGGSTSGSSPRTYDAGGGGEPNGAGRRRGNLPANGTATPRGTATGPGGGIVIIEGSGFYPWGYADGGVIGGFGGYYGGYYGAYDPWYGWFPTYAPSAYGSDNSGGLRLKVKPVEASVYADGFYVGIVDDFDSVFQKLRLDRGPHRIEIRAQEHQGLSVDVMIQDNLTITYRGKLERP